MVVGQIAVTKPSVTVLFDNDPSLFWDVWCDFYRVCLQWVNEAATKHGDGFSIKFELGVANPVACVRWNTEQVWLADYKPRIAVAFQKNHPALETFQPYTKNWEKALQPLILSHAEWKVCKLERDLAQAQYDLEQEKTGNIYID